MVTLCRVTTPDAPTDPTVPVFGRRSHPFEQQRWRRFAIEVETVERRWDEPFEAYTEVDAGTAIAMMNARTDMQQANAVSALLITALRDDDGASVSWVPPATPVLASENDPESDWLRDDDGEPLYELWNGEYVTSAELAEVTPLTHGSSRARFAAIMDSPDHRVQLEALLEIGEWMIGDAAKRPTRKPSPSGRGQRPTGRTREALSR